MSILTYLFGEKKPRERGMPKMDNPPPAPMSEPRPGKVVVSGGNRRSSAPTYAGGNTLIDVAKEKAMVLTPQFRVEIIPVIRKLAYLNPDLGQALNNLVELGNTGHSIKFDASVDAKTAAKMREHLTERVKAWGDSEAGMDGLVNKLISQIAISGALSEEWVPNETLTGVENIVLVNPETIVFKYDFTKVRHLPYQKANYLAGVKDDNGGLIALNPNTYRYSSLNGDTDDPYGYPPYLTALDAVAIQQLMLGSIKFLAEKFNITGLTEILYEKPDQLSGNESQTQYTARLERFLDTARQKASEGYKDGILVGYKGDTEFKFNSVTKEMDGLVKLFELNELMVASGIKMDATMLGRGYSTSETQITVIFTKLTSQLKNIQNLIKNHLEFGYALELRLAGFKFKNITVEFKPPTAVDRLKEAQADEIEIRNQNALYIDGIISQDQYAHSRGYESPSEPKPRFIRAGIQTEEQMRQDAAAKKDTNDRKNRDKNRPRPKKLGDRSTCEHCHHKFTISPYTLKSEEYGVIECPTCTHTYIEDEN